MIALPGEINHAMPDFVVGKVVDALNERRQSLNGVRVLVLGVACKRDLDDMRELPALTLIDPLRKKGADVVYHDPYIPVVRRTRRYALSLASVPLTAEELGWADVVLVATDRSDVDYEFVVRASRLVVDTRNATRKVTTGREKIVRA